MTQNNELTAESFWQYTNQVYRNPDVAALCLRLQDTCGVNVNMLLLLCWCLDHQRIVVLKQWQTLKAAIAHSEQTLKLHRQQRRAAKEPAHADHAQYATLKQQELNLEAQQQQELVDAFNNMQVESSDLPGINAGVVAFIHAWQLKDQPQAMDDLRTLIKLAL
ncbi:TIGR02444 family protein [Salinimonas lutimaris]|uniref:TIGR02444 family protein n=1 Tax=Salinimonas lutimaris TaxID=914153 RepID=UPI001586529F|nr:TIGR02444 family protein [Salinimonas lutimaris]